MFCGMGICQDCLVTMDGAPQPPRMTAVAKALVVETQVAFARFDTQAAPPAPAARHLAPEALVIGGGAGGLAAAAEAARAGASTVVLDERHVPRGSTSSSPPVPLRHSTPSSRKARR